MKRNLYAASIMLLSFLSFTSVSFTEANAQMIASSNFSVHSVKGRLIKHDGSTIANGSHTIVASVYQKGGTTAIYTETDMVTTTDGRFEIMLGANGRSKLNLGTNSCYELGLSVDGGAQPRGNRVTIVTPEHNQRLSKLRADRIKTRFVAQGVSPDKIASTMGFGTSDPSVKGRTDVSTAELVK